MIFLRQISLGKLGLVVGGILTVVGFIAYFANNPTVNLIGFFYGVSNKQLGLKIKFAAISHAIATVKRRILIPLYLTSV